MKRHPGRAPARLLLLHGVGGDHRHFDPLLPHLEPVETLVPAYPGRAGDGALPLASVPELAAWLWKRLGAWRSEGLVADRIVVLGHSLGGAVALELAATAPPAAGAPEPAGTPELIGLVLTATGARLRVSPTILEAARAAAEGIGEGLPAASTAPAATTLVDWLATDRFDRLGALAAVRAPALLLWGDADLLTPLRYGEYLRAHLRDARLVVLPGAGHTLPVEHPAWTGAQVRAWLETRDWRF